MAIFRHEFTSLIQKEYMNLDKSKNLIIQAINSLPNSYMCEKVKTTLFNGLNEIQNVQKRQNKKEQYINTFNKQLQDYKNHNMKPKEVEFALDKLEDLIKLEEEKLKKEEASSNTLFNE
jgi:hypothetical protein